MVTLPGWRKGLRETRSEAVWKIFVACYGLNCVLLKDMVKSCPPVPPTWALSGKRVTAEVIS